MESFILVGDCREALRSLPDQSVNTVVTSPPYFGLRDYGLEPSVWGGLFECGHKWEEHVTPAANGSVNTDMKGPTRNTSSATRKPRISSFCTLCNAWLGTLGLEPTPDLFAAHIVEVFREVRRVLRNDGTLWFNMGDSYARTGGTDRKAPPTATVGNTRNALEQMKDRKQRAPEGLKDKDLIGVPWLLAFALRADGWYLRSDIIWNKPNAMPESVRDRPTRAHENIFLLSKSSKYYYNADAIAEPAVSAGEVRWDPGTNGLGGADRKTGKSTRRFKQDGHGRRHAGFNERYFNGEPAALTRNKRDVWTVTTKPFKGAHFATFPPDLIEPCILAGCPEGGTVLDPFFGAGTTGLVAQRLGRNWIGCELNEEYALMAHNRIVNDVAAGV